MKKLVVAAICSISIFSNTACTRTILWNRYYNDGMKQFQAGNYAEAENLFCLALKQAQHKNMSIQERILSLRTLGLAQMSLDKDSQAQANLEKAGVLILETSGAESRDYAENLEDIGIALARQRKFEAASSNFKACLSIFAKLKVKDTGLGRPLQSLAYCQQKSGLVAEAAESYKRYFASLDLSASRGQKAVYTSLQEYRKLLGQLKNKTELVKTDIYLKKLSCKV